MPPRVLLVGNFLSGSLRTRTVSEDLATRLAAAGWDVQVTSTRPARLLRAVDMIQTAWSARGWFDVANVDVYSGPAFCWAEAVCAVLGTAGKPYVLTLHGGNLPAFGQRWPGRVRRLLHGAAAVTTPSRFLLDFVRPLRADAELLPNAIPIEAYAFRRRSRPAPRLIWLRSFHDIYHPSLAVEVLALLARSHPAAHLTMVGPDRGDGSLARAQRAATALGVAERVTFLGGVEKDAVPARLDEGDIFLNTSNVDNAPVTVLEAMASGLCVVSTAVGGVPHLVTDGDDALLVPARDANAMVAAVRRLLDEPGLAGRLSDRARQTAERFDWPPILERWKSLLARAAGTVRPR